MSLFGSKKQNEIDKLLNENDDLKNQLHSVLLKHGGYEELEKNILRSKKEAADLNSQAELLKSEIAQNDASRAEKEKYLGDLNSKILELEEIKDNLFQTIKSYDAQVAILEERSKELDEKLEKATEIDIKLSTLVEKKEKLDRDIADKEQTFSYLSSIERDIQTELENERNALDSVKGQADSARNEITELTSQFDAKNEQIELLKNQELEIAGRLESLNQDEVRKTQYIKSLDEKISLNEEIKNNLETNLSDLVARLNQNEKLYTEHSEKRELLSDELGKLQKERDAFENKLNLAKEQFELFNAEASKHSALLAALGEEINKIETARDNLKEELNDLKQTEEKQLAEISEKKKIIEELEVVKLELEETTLNAEKNFNALVEKYMLDFDDTRKINDDLHAELKEKAAEDASLNESLLEKRTQLKEQEEMLRIAEKENNHLDKHITDLKNEKERLLEKISLWRENISVYNSQFTSLRYETESMQIKKSDLQRDLSFLLTQISREYAEAENKMKTLNDSIALGNTVYKELNEKIAAAKEELNINHYVPGGTAIENKEIENNNIEYNGPVTAEPAKETDNQENDINPGAFNEEPDKN
jgi:chromosome segregation ATPase